MRIAFKLMEGGKVVNTGLQFFLFCFIQEREIQNKIFYPLIEQG